MNAEQKQRIAHEISNWRNARNDHSSQITGDRMADLLQELVDAPETEPVARVTGYYAGYLSIATVDGRVLPTGTALYAAPPAPSVPDMPLSMEQFGGLVGLARDDASEKAIVYKATNIYGETCYFGVKSTAQAWAKSGRVDEVRLRELRVVATPTQPEPPADVVRDAERYRWLREERFDKPYAVTNEHMNAVYEGDELDKAIDAAIKRDKLKGQQP